MRAVISYLILVGLPLLGIFAVLDGAKGLSPPMSVGGDWNAELEEVPAGASCLSPWVSPSFTIGMAQSGSRLTLLLKEGATAELRGKISKSRISAQAPDRSLELEADVEKREEGDRLSGFLKIRQCGERGTMRLSAVKHVQTPFIATRGF